MPASVEVTPLADRLAPVLRVAGVHATAVDQEGRFPSEAVEALRHSGLLGLTVPDEQGGLGGTPLDFVDVVRDLASECGSTAMVYLMHIAALMPVAAAAPPGLAGLVERMASGEQLGSLALSERGSRSHFWAPVSRQVTDNGSVTVRADKSWVTSAGYADVLVASALTADGGPTDSDLFALPTTTSGIAASGAWQGMGLRGNASAPMALNATFPATWRLGQPGEGFRLMMEVILPWFNIGNAAVSIGLARAASEAAVRHCSGARLEHLGEALADLPTIRARLSRMHILLDIQQTYLHAVARSLMAPEDSTQLRVLASKATANDAALVITDEAMRVCGGAAFSQHLAVDRYFRDARAGHVMAPTADALYDFYGKAITGRPLF